MKILVVGAGAIGGYFGGRLLEAGRDVTFLLRPARAEALRQSGLRIKSQLGDFFAASPSLVTEATLNQPFDLILLSCKAYDLEAAMASFAPAVGPDTVILPLLNGMRHIEVLAARFGAGSVLGGLCMISSTVAADGAIIHLNDSHILTFGALDRAEPLRLEAVAAALAGAKFDLRASETIRQDLWEKWIFIASLAGITCLMRAPLSDIGAAGAADLPVGLFDECAAIATAQGYAPRPAFIEQTRPIFAAASAPLTASMLRDIERGGPVEGDHILGDLLRRAGAGPNELLRIAFAHVAAYEARRLRQSV
jgi:2-dehydropantoate 2-reductase